MRKASFSKFNNYIINPDFANKFLLTNYNQIPKFKEKDIYFMYVFRQKSPYSFMAIKTLLMLNSVSLENSLTSSKIIILKFSKKESQSKVYISLNFNDLVKILTIFYKKPAPIKKVMNSFLSEKKHFIFPGYIKHLRIPSWKTNVNLTIQSSLKQKYWLYFYKSIFFD